MKSVKAFDNDLKETFEMVVQMSDNKLIDGRDFTSEYGRKSGISWCYSNATDMDDLYKFGILIDSCHGYHTYLYRNVTDGTWTKTVFGFLSPDGFPKDGSDNDLISWIVEHKRTDFYDALKAYASEAKKFIKKVEDAVDNLEDD